MSTFIESAACKGRRPERVAVSHLVARPELISRLLRERHVPRFLVAPDGFGKTQIAFQYADTVFSFLHVFWINGKSPCFLRDLDNGRIIYEMHKIENGTFLVVFEDIPRLDDERAENFSCLIDELLEKGNEVIVTCVPSRDAFGQRHRDRLKLDSSDFLLNEVERKLSTPISSSAIQSKNPVLASQVACLHWGGDSGVKLLNALVLEELPSEVFLVIFIMLVLREGDMNDVAAFVSMQIDTTFISRLVQGYPYLGITERDGTFYTIDVSTYALAGAFDGNLDTIITRSHFTTREVFIRRLADVLLARFEGKRACEVMNCFAPKPVCASWLCARSRKLMEEACVKPAYDLCIFAGRVRTLEKWTLAVSQSWRFVALEDYRGAIYAARHTAFATEAPLSLRACALIVLVRYGGDEVIKRAEESLRSLLENPDVKAASSQHLTDEKEKGEPISYWPPLARILLALRSSIHEGIKAWQDLRTTDTDPIFLMPATICLMGVLLKDYNLSAECNACPVIARQLREILDFMHQQIKELQDENMFLTSMISALLYERAAKFDFLSSVGPLSSDISFEAHRLELSLLSQRSDYRRDILEAEENKVNFETTHPDTYRRAKSQHRSVSRRSQTLAPMLHVDLFGGLIVHIGEERVDDSLLRRSKARTLLALLVISHGKEIPRDRLVQILWPKSELLTARRNFYSVFSQLKHALTIDAGFCPYLIRTQSGFRLEASLLDSDLERFDSLCRMLLFGSPRPEEWEMLFRQVSDWYADDLLPGENECEIVQGMRETCRDRLIDSLVSASGKLINAGEFRGGLWFAREALKHDESREDSYVALMEAQIAAGQRTAALETYFTCRRYLAEELGIDPSLRIAQLYRSCIETEEEFTW